MGADELSVPSAEAGCVAPEGASPEPCPIAVLPPSIVVPSLRPFDKLSLSKFGFVYFSPDISRELIIF